MNLSYGYARISSRDQSLSRQIVALHDYGLDDRHIITDKASGKDFAREGYQTLKTQLLRAGDTLVIKELDRLGRNYTQIKIEWQELLQMGVEIVVLDTPMLNTANKSDLEKKLIANIVFELLAYMSEKERLRIHARQAEGIAAAKAQGKRLGRPMIPMPPDFKEQYQKVLNHEISATQLMKTLGLKRNVFYRCIHELQK
ncbi:MAG TPA: recombinase family protein [Clostridia bacterium]|nr:recombinase family protein [Clostridia bacterium]